MFQQKELEKLTSKPEEQQTSTDSRVRAWVQATGEWTDNEIIIYYRTDFDELFISSDFYKHLSSCESLVMMLTTSCFIRKLVYIS